MSNKTDLVQAVERCQKVVDQEIVLLDRWASVCDAAGDIGRGAACRNSRNGIATGPNCPKHSVDSTVASAKATPESKVKSAPTSANLQQVSQCEASHASRKNLSPTGLGPQAFQDALDEANLNSKNAADLAARILQHCTKT